MKLRKAFFLDRDGVVNIDHGYVHRKENFDFVPGVIEACQKIQEAGYLIVIVTNQAGIGRGLYSEEEFTALTTWMLDTFKQNSVVITDVRYCPHHATAAKGKYLKDCVFRKPNPGMILSAANDHGIAISDSVMIGDKLSDMQAGVNAGISQLYQVSDNTRTTMVSDGVVHCHRLIDAVNHFLSSDTVPITLSHEP